MKSGPAKLTVSDSATLISSVPSLPPSSSETGRTAGTSPSSLDSSEPCTGGQRSCYCELVRFIETQLPQSHCPGSRWPGSQTLPWAPSSAPYPHHAYSWQQLAEGGRDKCDSSGAHQGRGHWGAGPPATTFSLLELLLCGPRLLSLHGVGLDLHLQALLAVRGQTAHHPLPHPAQADTDLKC